MDVFEQVEVVVDALGHIEVVIIASGTIDYGSGDGGGHSSLSSWFTFCTCSLIVNKH